MGIFLEGTTFFSINRCKLVARLKCRCKCRPLLFNCGYILEPRINFRGLKWGIDFWLRSEIGFGKSKILVWKRVRVSSFELYTPTKNFGEYSPPFLGLWKTAIYYVTLVEKCFWQIPGSKAWYQYKVHLVTKSALLKESTETYLSPQTPLTINRQDYKLDRIRSEPFSVRYWCRKHITYSFNLALSREKLIVNSEAEIVSISLKTALARCTVLVYCVSLKRYQRTSALSTSSRLKDGSTKLYYSIVSQRNRNWKVLSPCRF